MTFSNIGDLLSHAENDTPEWKEFLNDADEFFSKIEREDENRNDIDKKLSSKDMLEWLTSTVTKTKDCNNILNPDLPESKLDQTLVRTSRIKTAIKRFFKLNSINEIDVHQFLNYNELRSDLMFTAWLIPIKLDNKHYIIDEINGQGETYVSIAKYKKNDPIYQDITKWYEFDDVFNLKSLNQAKENETYMIELPNDEHEDDVKRILTACLNQGFWLTHQQAISAWESESDANAASWLDLDSLSDVDIASRVKYHVY